MELPQPVATACRELLYVAYEIGKCGCADLAAALKALLDKASGGAERALKATSERVELAELQLDLLEELGPRPYWLDAVAYVVAKMYTKCRGDGLLALALCAWAAERYPDDPLWRIIEEVKPEEEYNASFARRGPLHRRVWRLAVETFGRPATGRDLILSALLLMALRRGKGRLG